LAVSILLNCNHPAQPQSVQNTPLAFTTTGMQPLCIETELKHETEPGTLAPLSQDTNVPEYVRYSVAVFSLFGPHIKLWTTSYEPTVGHPTCSLTGPLEYSLLMVCVVPFHNM
jgi:hypothetical protein